MTNKTILVIPDSHSTPNHNNDRFTWLGKFIIDRKPDIVVNIGDFADMGSLCSYDVGRKSFEGRRYKKDIEACIDAQEKMFAPIKAYNKQQKANKQKQYKPRYINTLGNHESIHEDTEVLTSTGWVVAKDITEKSIVASFNAVNKKITYDTPIKVSSNPCNRWLKVSGNFHDELVSYNHRLFHNGKLVKDIPAGKYNQKEFTYAGYGGIVSRDINELKLLTWIVMDGCIVISSPTKQRIQFKLSKDRKIKALQELLVSMGVPYTFKVCKKSGINKLQPYYIRIYGEYARNFIKLLGENKTLPQWFSHLDQKEAKAVLDTLEITDGSRKDRGITWTTTCLNDVETIQLMCINNNIPCKYTNYNYDNSGFKNGKPKYRVTIVDTGLSNKFYNTVEYFEDSTLGNVISITTVNDTLITRRNGKVCFTGNSRINRAVEQDAVLDGTIGIQDLKFKEFGWEVYPFLTPVVVEGVAFCHYFSSGVMGRPISGEHPAYSLITKKLQSCVQGHSHLREFAERTTAEGRKIQGLTVGCYLDIDQWEDYAGEANKMWWKGLVMLHDVHDGQFEPEFINIKQIKVKYGT